MRFNCILSMFFGNAFFRLYRIHLTTIHTNRLSFIQVKTGAKVTIPIHPIVKIILEKYDYKLPPVPPNNQFNEIIKKVAAKMPCMHVPFTKQITYKRELTEIVKMKYDYMMTHTARRSFCSNEFIKELTR